jgi:hypothetical protein
MKVLRITRRLAPLAIMALAVTAGIASASTTIPNTAVPLSLTGEDINDPQVAVDPSGNAFYAWVRDEPGAGTKKFIQAVRVASNGTVGTVHTISNTAVSASSPAIAAAPDGTAIVVFQQIQTVNPPLREVLSTRINADGSLGSSLPMSTAGEDAIDPDVGIDGTGKALVVWNDIFQTLTKFIRARTRTGDALGSPIEDAASQATRDAVEPDLAVAPNGDAILALRRSGATEAIYFKRRLANGTWQTANLGTAVSGEDTADKDLPEVAIDPTGEADAVITWREDVGSTNAILARRIESTESSSVAGLVKAISNASQNATEPEVDMDGAGNAYLVWTRNNGTVNVPQERIMAQNSTLGTTADLNPAGTANGDQPQVAVDTAGNATFAWRFGLNIETRSLPVGGALTSIQPLTTTGSNTEPRVDANAAGARWGAYRLDGASSNDQAFGFFDSTGPGPADTTGPVVTITSGPSGPTSDHQPTFTFTSNEPAAFLCSFDGGTSAPCSSVGPVSGTHTPSAPLSDGGHTFTVLAFDAAVNLGAAGRAFSVFTPPPTAVTPPPPAGTTTTRKKCKKPKRRAAAAKKKCKKKK